MTDRKKIEIEVLRACVNADLKASEMKMIVHLLTTQEKIFRVSNADLAKQLNPKSKQEKQKTSNIARTIKSLEDKNVLAVKIKNGLEHFYVKASSQWNKQQTTE